MKSLSCVGCSCLGCSRIKLESGTRGYCDRCEICKDNPVLTYCKWREEKELEDNNENT